MGLVMVTINVPQLLYCKKSFKLVSHLNHHHDVDRRRAAWEERIIDCRQLKINWIARLFSVVIKLAPKTLKLALIFIFIYFTTYYVM